MCVMSKRGIKDQLRDILSDDNITRDEKVQKVRDVLAGTNPSGTNPSGTNPSGNNPSGNPDDSFKQGLGGTSQQRQSQGGGSSQGGDSQNGTNNTQQPQSEYDKGYDLGGRYAYEIYYNRGLEPIFKNQHVLPPLEKIKVKNK